MSIQVGGVLKMKIKNWSKFQHFKDRRPPWIKLYRDLLDDMQWHELDPLSSKVLVTLWLLASEDQDGCLPDTKTLAWRMRMTEKQVLDCISKLSHWLEQDDYTLISERYQDDLPETERETETKRETKKSATVVARPLDVSEQVWQDWLALRKAKKAAVTATVLLGARKEAFKLDWPLEKFLVEWCTRGSQGLKAEWVQPKQSFAQQAADVARTTVPAVNRGPDPALVRIEQDLKRAVPMPDYIRQQINSVIKKV
jgi:hypothetical protein